MLDHAARLSLALLCAVAAARGVSEAQSSTDSTVVARQFAVAVAHDLIVARRLPTSPPSICLQITALDAPAAFGATLRDSARRSFGSALTASDTALRYHVLAQHLAITPHEAALEVRSTLGRPGETTHQQWRVVYFAARNSTGWHVRPGIPREVARTIGSPPPDTATPCLAR